MRRFYSEDDIMRWRKVDAKSIGIHLDKMTNDLPEPMIDFHLAGLAGAYYSQGMTFIAQGAFGEAIESLHHSTAAKCEMYERFEAGKGRALEAGNFQSVLVAFVTKDEAFISRFVALYRADEGTPGSIFLGKALKLMATRDIDGAKIALAQKKPQFEPQFAAYSDCFEAIACKDLPRFVSALNIATENWAKWASKRVKGLPDSVCFIQGAGLIRLAERVFGNPISIANKYIPPELIQ